MDRQYNDQKKHGQTIQRPKETWTDNTTTKRMLLLVFVLSVHVSFGRCIVCPCFFWSLYCLSMFLLVVVLSVHVSRQYNHQRKHGQAIQRPKEAWTDNTTTKRNMDSVSFGRCIACPCFFWSLYCLSMFLLVVVLSDHVSFGRCKETWTDNTTTKRNMDRQYNGQKKHGQATQLPKETWSDNTTTKSVSFGRCIAYPCFFWKLYCLSIFLLVVVLSVHASFGRCIAWTDNTTTKGNMDRQYNDQKKHGQTIQRPKETWTESMFLLVVVLSVHASFGRCIVCPCFFWSLY
jgi:ABC-type branched-subunit amino acid transport system permease subunit